MKLYTINATPYRDGADASINNINLVEYPTVVARILSNFGLDGFTIYKVDGYWRGKSEPSFKIEIAMDDNTNPGGVNADATAEMIAQELATVYNQDAVMLTLPNNTVKFIEQ